jgi:hypothetical protein
MVEITFADAPFVARVSERNEIKIVERGGDLICESTRSVMILTLIFSFFWGCLLTYIVWGSIIQRTSAHAAKSVQTPWLAICIMGFFGLISWLAFLRTLLGKAHFEVSGATGEFSFFRRRTRKPWKTLPAAEIAHFTIEKQFYTYKQHQTENAVLLLFTTAGERRALCASPDEALINSLARRLEQLTQRQLKSALSG